MLNFLGITRKCLFRARHGGKCFSSQYSRGRDEGDEDLRDIFTYRKSQGCPDLYDSCVKYWSAVEL